MGAFGLDEAHRADEARLACSSEIAPCHSRPSAIGRDIALENRIHSFLLVVIKPSKFESRCVGDGQIAAWSGNRDLYQPPRKTANRSFRLPQSFGFAENRPSALPDCRGAASPRWP